ncbi:MAG: BsuPI-related putative proteinase inhibitor [Candidatus Baldrarchaeia archaeon]
MVKAFLKIKERRFKVGEVLSFSLEILNTQDKTLKLFFPTSKIYDFVVYDESGKEVYRWSGNKLFTQAITRIVLKPKETKVFSLEWDQKVGFGEKAKPGNYQIIGEVGPFWLEDKKEKLIVKTPSLNVEII